MAKNTAVFGIYRSVAHAEQAVDHLVVAGFANQDISVLLPDTQSSKEFAHEKNTKAPEGTVTGVTTGGAIGGTLGLLAGIGALAIPGVGPFIAGGPSWERLPDWALAAPWAVWWVPWWVWAFPNMRQSDTKGELKRVVFFSPSIAIHLPRSIRPKICSRKPAPRIFLLREKNLSAAMELLKVKRKPFNLLVDAGYRFSRVGLNAARAQ
jgi:hypothetical protein